MTPIAMGDERRWAARYQFLEQLWRGRNRIVCDRELEGVLHAGIQGPLAAFLAELIPADGGDAKAWVALHNDRRAASFARAHSGTVFVGVGDAAQLASEEDWKVALLNVDGADRAALEACLEILAERIEDDPTRSVIVTLSCGDGHGDGEDETYEQLAELVDELFGDGRIYGLTHPGMLAFYDFGPVLDPDDDGDGDGDGGPADDEVGVEIDNTLGTQTPSFDAFIAVIGASLPGEGVTFIELPTPTSAAQSETEELTALRVQLAEAQRRGDMHAIERQAQLEQLEQAEDRIASLQDALADADEDPHRSTPEPADGDASGDVPGRSNSNGADAIAEALAREQSLRWELDRLRGELEHARARPVEVLEAEVASLRAQLERAEAELDELDDLAASALQVHDEEQAHLARQARQDHQAPLGDPSGRIGAADPGAHAAALGELLDAEGPTSAQAREWMRAKAKLEHLLHKLERGGQLSALALHRELSSLRRLL